MVTTEPIDVLKGNVREVCPASFGTGLLPSGAQLL